MVQLVRYLVPFEIRKKIYIWKTKIEDHRRRVEFDSVFDENLCFSPVLNIQELSLHTETIHILGIVWYFDLVWERYCPE